MLFRSWRVLSDPGRRALYDASLRTKSSAPPRPATPTPARPPEPADRGGRFPKWPFVMIFVFAVIFIVTAGALYRPSPPARPDNLLVAGSCVTIQSNRDAVEVDCGASYDAVVVTVVNFDASCPTDTETYRDRQGRGYACVRKVP